MQGVYFGIRHPLRRVKLVIKSGLDKIIRAVYSAKNDDDDDDKLVRGDPYAGKLLTLDARATVRI